jgi:adenine-specific DNA-methyltransferase
VLNDQQDLFLTEPTSIDKADVPKDALLGQWFTPAWAAEIMAADALKGMDGVGVIEPSCGDGAFLAAIPASHHAVGVEIDPRMAAAARASTGRTVVVGDFATVDVTVDGLGVILGNPPYSMDIIDSFMRRSHGLLPEDGLLAMLLPSHVLSTTSRLERWNAMFGSIEQRIVPRSLFPRISLPLIWTRFVKTKRRTLVGFMLFDQQTDVETMPRQVRRALGRQGTWREAVRIAIEAHGGQASLSQIYASIEPKRPSGNVWWKDKVRQICALNFERRPDHVFAIPQAA